MQTADVIAACALLVSIVAGWLSFRSTQVAQRAFLLSKKQAARLEAGLSMELLAYESLRTSDGMQRLFAFRVAVSNSSDAATSLRAIELTLLCSRRVGPITLFRLSSDPEIAYSGAPGLERLRPPVALAGRSTIAGTAVFRLPLELLETADIESYTIRAIDSVGSVAEREALFVNERASSRVASN